MQLADEPSSMRRFGEQFGQADEIVGGHREGELPIDPGQPAMPHLAQAGHRLGPAKGLLNAFADALRDRLAGMAGGAAIDRRAPPALVLRTCRVTVCSRSSMTKSALS